MSRGHLVTAGGMTVGVPPDDELNRENRRTSWSHMFGMFHAPSAIERGDITAADASEGVTAVDIDALLAQQVGALIDAACQKLNKPRTMLDARVRHRLSPAGTAVFVEFVMPADADLDLLQSVIRELETGAQ